MADPLPLELERLGALYRAHQWIEALDEVPRVLALAREQRDRAHASWLLLLRAKCLQRLGDLDAAEHAAAQALQGAPRARRAEILRVSGVFRMLRDDRAGARGLLQQSLEFVPDGDLVQRALVVRALADVSPPAEAEALLEQLLTLELKPHARGSTLYRLGSLQLARGDEDGGFERLLQAGALMEPDHATYQGYRCDLGLHLLRRGELDAAQDTFEQVRGGGLLATARALGLAAVAVSTGETAAFEDHDRTRRHAMLDRRTNSEVAQIAELAARSALAQADLDRAARCEHAAWHLHRTADRGACETRLAELRAQGAPAVLGSFLIREPIGEGGMATVWRATPLEGSDDVAIKVVAPEHADASELDAVGGLDHPGIVPLLDHGRVDGACSAADPALELGAVWLAMPLCDAGTLAHQCGSAPWETVRHWLLTVLDALGHAHARGLLHLDVKAANVLRVGTEVQLADFGIARWLGTHHGRAMGSPSAMAPEQWRRSGRGLGPWTDLYGVGCLATELVQGTPVWSGTSERLRQHHLRSEPPGLEPRIAVPDELDAWIRRCLAKIGTERFRRAGEAARALRALGPPTRQPVEPASGPAQWTTTFGFDDLPTEEVEPLSPAESLLPRPGPVVPQPARVPLSASPAGASALSLFGLRPPRWVGREPQRAVLWQALQRVVESGRGEAVVLVGAAGLGARRLAAWIGERAHHDAEVALLGPDDPVTDAPAVVVAPHLPAGHPLWQRLDGAVPASVLVVASAAADPGFGTSVPLEPLDDEHIASLCRHLLPLAPVRVQALTAAADGNPQWLLQTLHDLVARDRLRPTPAGLDLRPGTSWNPAPSLASLWRRRARWLREVLSTEELVQLRLHPEDLAPQRVSWLLRRGVVERRGQGWRLMEPLADEPLDSESGWSTI